QINEIKKLQQSINAFTKESKLKDFDFRDRDMKIIKLLDTISKPTVITFWTKNALNHFKKSNDQIALIQQKHPEIQFVSINIDNDENVLKMFESLFPRHSNIYLQATDFEELRDQWVILRLNRAIYINKNGYIVEGFINIFDVQLKLNYRLIIIIITINIIGFGNVATNLIMHINTLEDYTIQAIYSRSKNTTQNLPIVNNINKLRSADITLISVTDDAIAELSACL